MRSITTGTAVVATMATAGFGALAAFTWAGTSTDAATDDTTVGTTVAQLDPDEDGDPGADAPIDRVTDATGGPAATATPIRPTPTPITTTKKKSRVSSGGSG